MFRQKKEYGLVVVSEYGEAVMEPKSEFDDRPKGDATSLHRGAALIHEVCQGLVDVVWTSYTHNALHCRVCHMRIVIPIEVNTFSELKKYFEEYQCIRPATDNEVKALMTQPLASGSEG